LTIQAAAAVGQIADELCIDWALLAQAKPAYDLQSWASQLRIAIPGEMLVLAILGRKLVPSRHGLFEFFL
jgi:hypothetical protein